MDKKHYIKKALKFAFSGSSIFFIGMLVFIVVYDALTGATSKQYQNTVQGMAF